MMKRIGDVLQGLADGGWRENWRRAVLLSQMEAAAKRHIAAAGFDEISCCAVSCEDGELHLKVADSPAYARLRQMRESLLEKLQEEFPEIKSLHFGIQL